MKCFHLGRHCCIPFPSSTRVPAPLFDWTRYGRGCDWGKREHQALWRACGNLFLARLPAVTPLDMGDERNLALQLALWLSSFGLPRTVSGNRCVESEGSKMRKCWCSWCAILSKKKKTTCLPTLLSCSQWCHSVHQPWSLGPWRRFPVFAGYIALFLHMLKVLQWRCIKMALTFFPIETFVLWEHISKEM